VRLTGRKRGTGQVLSAAIRNGRQGSQAGTMLYQISCTPRAGSDVYGPSSRLLEGCDELGDVLVGDAAKLADLDAA
jgi:hypothetical protein